MGGQAQYEARTVRYQVPAAEHRYTPDFVLGNGVIVEAKGRFDAADRARHLLIRAQHPDLDIRFVFQRASLPICKGSRTTCVDWCRRHGFQYADGAVPPSWLG